MKRGAFTDRSAIVGKKPSATGGGVLAPEPKPPPVPDASALKRRADALFSARLHIEKRTLLSDAAVWEICAELVATRAEADALALDNNRLRGKITVRRRAK